MFPLAASAGLISWPAVRRWCLLGALVGVVAGLLGVGAVGIGLGHDADYEHKTLVVSAVAFMCAGIAIVVTTPDRPAGRLLIAGGVVAAASVAAEGWSDVNGAIKLVGDALWWAPSALVGYALLTEPEWGASPRRSRLSIRGVAAASIGLATLGLAVDSITDDGSGLGTTVLALTAVAIGVLPLLLLASGITNVVRCRHAGVRRRRRSYRRLAAIAALVLAAVVATSPGMSWSFVVAATLVAVAVISWEDPLLYVARVLNRLLYGRVDPYAVLARLGGLLECALEPQTVHPTVARTIATALDSPYVAIALSGPRGPDVVAAYGTATPNVEAFDMVAHGHHVGRLIVAPPRDEDDFSSRQRKYLADFARQAAIAEQAIHLVSDLQDSRERLVVVREEERRCLRRDLHDGLGPSMSSLALQVHALRKHLGNPARAADILGAIAANLEAATLDLRRVVGHLGPPILDAGLKGALEARCLAYRDSSVDIALVVDGAVDGLPAAVEIAAYRVVSEALANVVRHARADRCVVRVGRDDHLTIEVTDNGTGLPQARRPGGVGLTSMRDRAEELGGTCEFTASESGGTVVRVRFPLLSAPAVVAANERNCP